MKVRILLVFALLVSVLRAERLQFSWPVPSPTLPGVHSEDDFLQATAAGDAPSGGFGCVRTHGFQYHEGLDIKPVKRNARGEPEDNVRAAIDGIVRHISAFAGNSNYGRYIVLEHPDAVPEIYTLYAHLARIAPGLHVGEHVQRGQIIGLMGHSAGGYYIPLSRAHLHFEIGLRISDTFDSWYKWKRFGGVNEHGNFNGMNLMGFDPWAFVQALQHHEVNEPVEYLSRQPIAVRFRIATTRRPFFVRQYPSLVARNPRAELLGGWEVWCTFTGLPVHWIPLSPADVVGMRPDQVVITGYNEDILKHHQCRRLVARHFGRLVPGRDLADMIQLVFGVR